MSTKARKLGRGLDSLIRRSADPDTGESKPEILEVAPSEIQENPDQPRREFDEEKLTELADSIRAHGILQPLVVRRRGGGLELVAGERRLRASRKLGLPKIPVVVGEFDAENLLDLALIENIQRVDLNPVELAEAYQALKDTNDWTQAALAHHLGMKRSSIANALRILELPKSIQASLEAGEITKGHVKVLLSLKSSEEQVDHHRAVLEFGLTVRELEDRVHGSPEPQESTEETGTAAPAEGVPATRRGGRNRTTKDPQVLAEEQKLGEALGTKVEIKEGRGRKGRIVVEYYSLDDYMRIRDRMTGGE